MSKKVSIVACAMGAVLAAAGVVAWGDGPSGAATGGVSEKDFVAVRDAYLAKFKPLFIESAKAWWEAQTTGSDAAFAKKKEAEKALVELHADKAMFARVKAIKEGGQITEPTAARELDVMYRSYLAGQGDPAIQKKIVELENEVEQIFNTHRSTVDGKAMTENDVRKVLSDSKDGKLCEKAWKGYMDVGAKIEPKLKELVGLRNELARQLGFKNFYVMKLELNEIHEKDLFALFDELDTLTRGPFAEVKKEIDGAMAARFGAKADDLRPWNFGDLFFQESPSIEPVNLDDIYKDVDLFKMTKDYYASMGMSIDDILARSDMYEKPGKSPHAFSTNINRGDDVRVLCNLKPNAFWADTILHEVGHAVYDKYIDPGVPFLLHEPAHSLTTEGYAMEMGAMSKNEDFLVKALKLPPARAAEVVKSASKSLRAEKLIFSRWAQVMVRFEHGMYENPSQDLGKLWWDLKKQYQMLNPPETLSRPDYAAKIHVVTTPAYYHSYMMGELFACQVQEHIAKHVLGGVDPTKTSFYGRKEAGDYLRRAIFGPGDRYSWDDLTRRATGSPLSAKAFAKQYVGG